MFQRLVRMTSAILLSFTLFVFPVMFGSGLEIDLQAQGNVRDEIETLAKIGALQARPDAERAQMVALLSQLSGADPI